jgi:hypothetical protein
MLPLGFPGVQLKNQQTTLIQSNPILTRYVDRYVVVHVKDPEYIHGLIWLLMRLGCCGEWRVEKGEGREVLIMSCSLCNELLIINTVSLSLPPWSWSFGCCIKIAPPGRTLYAWLHHTMDLSPAPDYSLQPVG